MDHILCSDGFVGEFAAAINERCCQVWRRLAQITDPKLGMAMVKVFESTTNAGCLSADEKKLIRKWPPHQLRYAVTSIVHACETYGSVDPHLTKLKAFPDMDPAIWVWSVPGTVSSAQPCAVYMVFLHPDFDLTFPDDCGSYPNPSSSRRPRRSS